MDRGFAFHQIPTDSLRRGPMLMPTSLLIAVAVTLAPAMLSAQQRTEKLQGYAELVRGDALIVGGQRIVADAGTRVTGSGDVRSLSAIPLGYEAKVQGRRPADGAIIASRVEARPNGQERYEAEARAASDEVEQAWVAKRMMVRAPRQRQNGEDRAHSGVRALCRPGPAHHGTTPGRS
jgi:hypothetical protein